MGKSANCTTKMMNILLVCDRKSTLASLSGLAIVLLTCCLTGGATAETIALWDFHSDMQGWEASVHVTDAQYSAEGLTCNLDGDEAFLTSPAVDCSVKGFIQVSWYMRSTGDNLGQLFIGEPFLETNRHDFTVYNDGLWHSYRVSIPSDDSGKRIRLVPSRSKGKITLSSVRVELTVETPEDKFATPLELRDKKIIGGGLYTTYGEESAITPRFLARHPEFVDSYPFDGIVVPAPLSTEWVKSLGLTKMGKPWLPAYLNELLWNTIAIPEEAVAQTVDDLKSFRRGSLSDNFLIVGMVDGARGLHTPNLADDAEWAIIEQNARLAARLCRDGQLVGFWLDTEQYGYYRWRTESGTPEFDTEKPQDLHFPLGKDTPEILRRRGTQWIQAVQAEFPAIKIMTTFAWSPDSNVYGPLTGVIPFLDGVLAGIETPAQIHHCHENTFYFGQAKGTTHTYATENGIPGDRNRYELARAEIRNWRALSNNPQKYDAFVKVGMAAWVEDHPWNVPDGWPIGSRATLWSNVPFALAYTDEYVWVWSEHTKYGQPNLREVNPFLSSLSNQTRNGKFDITTAIAEDYQNDPLLSGWYFDFDMLAIGRKSDPDHEASVMSIESQPYRWDKHERQLNVTGENKLRFRGQRRRFVHPITADSTHHDFSACLEFKVENFGTSKDNPIVMGLFNSQRLLEESSLCVQIASPTDVSLVFQSNGSRRSIPIPLPDGLRTEKTYNIKLHYSKQSRELNAVLSGLTLEADCPAFVELCLPEEFASEVLDEFGIAIFENPINDSQPQNEYRYAVLNSTFSSQ